MLKTFLRLYPRITSIQQFPPSGSKFFNNRQWCSLTQLSTPVASALQKIINISDQNDLEKDQVTSALSPKGNESNQNALDEPVRRRRPVPQPKGLAEAVRRSQFLRNMVDIGVNLFEMEKNRPRDLDFIVSLRTWDPEPPERIRFLLRLGVPQESISTIITKNPWILKENMEDMEVRVNYLESKRFTPENIATIVVGCPLLLTMKTKDIDARLGYFQHGYKLSGNQVRQLAITYPWMISHPDYKLRDTLDTLSDKLSFNITDMKSLILNHGTIWKCPADDIKKTAEFLHLELKMSHKKIVQYGHLLTKRCGLMRSRYEFMVFMKRANFDPKKQYYNSYDILWEGQLEDFCKKLHTNVEALDLYAKSI